MSDFYVGPDRRGAALPPLAERTYPWVHPGLAFFALAVFAAVAAGSFMTDDATLRTQTVSTWSNIAIAVVAYWFGSSAGSTKKDEAIAATAIKQNETIAEQGKALAVSAPPAPISVSQTVDAGPPATATATATSGEPIPAEPKP